MPEALPSVRTVQTAIHAEYKTIDEGCFRFDDLVEHLEKYGSIAAVSIGEDATRVIARILKLTAALVLFCQWMHLIY